MLATYQKCSFNEYPGFTLNHTAGFGAGASTLDYPHTTIHPMLMYILHGKGTILVEGVRYSIGEGDAVLLTPGELFHCQIDNQVYHERIVLHFHPETFHSLPCDTSNLFDPFSKRKHGAGNLIGAATMQSTGLAAQISELLALVQRADPQIGLQCLCTITQILILLTDAATSSGYAHSDTSALTDSILAYLNEHYSEQISIESVAKAFGLSKSYLSHLFKEQVGMSLWNYVILRRLHLFNDLLRQGRAIEETCYDVGFQNYSNFFRLYKKHMGITPTQYKKRKK